MRSQDLMTMLQVTIENGLPVLIKGAPGVGKSDIVAQAADKADADLLIEHPVVSDPTDAKGLPGIVAGKAEFLPFGNLRKMIEAEDLTVVFLDDLGQAPAVVQAAYMQLILARRINGHAVSDKVVFIAATNRREDRAGVTGILEPVKSRFASIVELTPHVDDWSNWALTHNVPAEVVAFVRFRPELMLKPGNVTNDIVNRPSPRTVTQMGRLFAAGLQGLEPLSGAVGEGFASEFIGFLRTWQNLPNIDNILINPDTAKIPSVKELGALYAVATALATRATKDSFARIVRYLDRLPQEYCVLGVKDCANVCPAVCQTSAYIKWGSEHADLLV